MSGNPIISAVADSAIQRWRSKRFTRESSPEPSLNFVLPESSTGPSTKLEIETWLIDVYSDRSTKFLPSADWLIAKLKTIKKDQDVWSRFANLRPHWRNAILEFLKFEKKSEWILYHLDVPKKLSRTRLFGQRRDEQLVQLVLCRRRMNDEDGDMQKSRSKTEGRGDSLAKRVSFATKFEEESGAESEVNAASDHILPRYTSGLKGRIAILEGKRNRLGVDDQERIGDLNYMIAYLRDQLSDATHTDALNTKAFQDERQPKPRRTDSIRTPTIIHKEYIPHQSRRDDIIALNENFDRGISPPSRRPSNADNTTVASHYPRFTHDDLEIRETESSPGKTDYEDRHGVSNDSYYEPRERRRNHREEEDVTVEENVDTTYPGNDSFSQKSWRERSRYRLPPSRQYSTSTHGGPLIVPTRERSWERLNPRTSRASRQPYREIDYDDYFERQMVGDDHGRSRNRTRERKEAWSPKRREIMIRRNERSKPRPRERQNLSSSESEYTYNRSRGRRGQPIVGESAQSQALVLRAGASGLPYEYIRERVLNGDIRVRGDDDIGSPRPEYVTLQHVRRPSRPPTSRMGSFRDRSWAPSLRRRLSETWQQFEPSEDDEYRYPSMKRVDSERKGSEAELSDAEVIAQTLKRFTTIQDSDMPRTDMAAPSIQKKRNSETEVGASALKNTSRPLLGLERRNSLPVPGGRKAHFEQDNEEPQPDEERQSRATNGGSKSVDERPFLDNISEEPDVIIEGGDVPHHQRFVYFPERPVLPRPEQAPSFPFPTDLDHHSREASPRPQSRNPNLDSPRSRPGNGPSITEHGGHSLASQGEIPDHAAQEERYDEVENTYFQDMRY